MEFSKLFRPVGCLHCRKTGYSGRTALFELLIMDEMLISMIVKKEPIDDIRRAAAKNGMRMLGSQGLEKVIRGQTSLEEVLEITVVD